MRKIWTPQTRWEAYYVPQTSYLDLRLRAGGILGNKWMREGRGGRGRREGEGERRGSRGV